MSYSPLNSIHGNLYHAKLLAHFLIRGITAGYSFELGREEVGVGKFDDVVFSYKVTTDRNKEHWHYRYIQCKHKYKESSEKITASELLDENNKRFGLRDYLSSFDKIVKTGVDVQDCIICTNMSFDENSFKKVGIKLLPQNDHEDILAFNNLPNNKLSKRYKLEVPMNLYASLKHQVLNKHNCAVSYKLLDSFFQKLVFVVETPSESQLDSIRTEMVEKYLKLTNGEFQSAYLLKEILDWFTKADCPSMSSKDGEDLLQKIKFKMESTRVSNLSTRYSNHLKEILEFNEDAVNKMAKKLEPLFFHYLSNKVVRMITSLPKCTAAKVIPVLSAFQEPSSDTAVTHLLMPSHYLLDKDETECWNKSFCLNDSHRFLVIVYEGDEAIQDDQYYLKLMPEVENKKTIILIGSKNNYRKNHFSLFIKDFILYSDLSDDSKHALLSKTVLFQGYELTVRKIIGDSAQADEIIDLPSMEEFLTEKHLTVPSYSVPYTDKKMYIKRTLKFPCLLDSQVLDKITKNINSKIATPENSDVNKNIEVNSKGVNWIGNWVDRSSKLKTWSDIVSVLKENSNPESQCSVSEDEFLKIHSNEKQLVVISGFPGAGKSTLMSHQYEQIKNSNPNTWVIRLNLNQHSHVFLQFADESMSLSSVTQFFLNRFPAVYNSSAFAGSLLKHRLETSGQIVLILDGLDEIDGQVRRKAIKFLKAVSLTKLDRVYVTTRPHIKEKVERNLFQFAYTLQNFNRTDQIRYLEEIWQENLNVPLTESVHQFASSLVNRVSETLDDEERSFVGIPLQCRIIAECFQSNMQAILQTNADSTLELQENFNVIGLYKKFTDTKRNVFRTEKSSPLAFNSIMNYAINLLIRKIEAHLTELAIQKIAEKENHVKLLWPYSPTYQSLADQTEEANEIEEYSLKYGLTCKDGDGGKLQFMHRTFAEFLFANYLYEGFLIDDEKRNRLLDNKEVRHLIFDKILVYDQYNGVRFFFDAMLKDIITSKEWRKVLIDPRLGGQPLRYIVLAINANKALSTALLNRNKNVFTLFCDCIDATQYGQMRRASEVIRYMFGDEFWFTRQRDYYAQSSTILKRLLSYYKCASVKEVKSVLIHMMDGGSSGCISKMKYTLSNEEERGKVMQIVLDFMHTHRNILKQLDERENPNLESYKGEMLKVLLCNTFYNGFIQQFFGLLSWLYNDKDNSFIELLNIAIAKCCSKKASDDATIEQILYTLQDLGRLNIVHRISCVTLKWNPIAFEHFYQLNLPQDMITESTDIQSLLVQNSAGMTQMHRAAFYGEAEVSQRLLDFRLTPDNRKIAQKIVIDHYMASDGDLLTPLHIAATRGQETIVRNTLQFFKKVLSDHKLRKDLTSTNGLLYNVMKDAFMYRNYTMIQLVSKSVKLFLGRGYFIDLLKSQNNNVCRNANLLTIIAETLGEYDFLISLLVKDKNNSEIVRNIEENILLEMLKVKGRDDFVDWLLTANLADGFERIAQLFEKIEIDQLSKIVGTIISTNKGKSYWVKWLNQEFVVDAIGLSSKKLNCFQTCVTWISKYLSENTLKNVLIQDNCKATIRVLFLCCEENPVNFALTCLSTDKQKEVGIRIINNLWPVMRDLFINPPLSPEEDELFVYWMNILQLVLDYANKRQLSKFVNTILQKHDLNDTKCNIWSVFFDSGEFIENMVDKVSKFFKSVTDKLGEDALKDLLLDDGAKTITQAVWYYEGLTEVALAHLSDEKKSEIAKCIIENANVNVPQLIANMSVNDNPDFYPTGICGVPFNDEKPNFFRWLNISQLVIDFGDVRQLSNAVQYLVRKQDEGHSIWEDCLVHNYFPDKFAEKLSAFLQGVSEKLGNDVVKDLLLYKRWNVSIICWVKIFNEVLYNFFLSHLNDENRQQVELLMTTAPQENCENRR